MGLTIIQKVLIVLFLLEVSYNLISSVWKRKKLTLGAIETTILPAALILYFAPRLHFISNVCLPLQIVGLTLFVIGSIFGLYAFAHLGYINSDDFWIARKEKKERHLIQSGPYNYIRHPIMVALIIEYLGVTLVLLHPVSIAIFLFGLIAGIYTSFREEKFMTSKFPEYATYAKKTGRFLPKLDI
jgi:protein-S-isoprenylcysteine O-methyltransferase Ste14